MARLCSMEEVGCVRIGVEVAPGAAPRPGGAPPAAAAPLPAHLLPDVPTALPAAGSTLATRKAAAAQIAAIAGAHPAQLPSVVAAVARHLRHRDWDARVAAGHCLGLLAEHFQHHTPADLAAAAARQAATEAVAGRKGESQASTADLPEPVKQEGGSEPADAGAAATAAGGAAEPALHLLSFASFDVQQVLAQGTPMLASGGEVGRPLATAGAQHSRGPRAAFSCPGRICRLRWSSSLH